MQFAHYLGYFLMSLPAGWLATKLGYKGGIIAGLLMVAVGRVLVHPGDARSRTFRAFLLGVCVIASGLTFLETIANPYTTVLGPSQYAATRINLAQSCNGVGWIFGPIAGGMFFYAKDASGASTGSQTLWIPYAGVAVVVMLLAVDLLLCQACRTSRPRTTIISDDKDDVPRPRRRPRPRKVDADSVYSLLLAQRGGADRHCRHDPLGDPPTVLLGEKLVGTASGIPRLAWITARRTTPWAWSWWWWPRW